MYIDGVEDVALTLSGSAPDVWCQMYLGKCDCGPGEYTKGKLDDMGIWNRALTANEVLQLFNSSSRFIVRSQ
jgi:hypothetical protein